MARTVPWERDPHTAAKHDLYRDYMEKWFPILMRGFEGDIVYAEGFSGPGVYDRGEPGSPVLALNAALTKAPTPTPERPIKFALVDADARCIKLLREQIDLALRSADPPAPPSPALRIEITQGNCEEHLPHLLDVLNAWDRPRLVVLDSFGGAVSAKFLNRLTAGPAPEVLVTIQPQHFSRFASDPGHQGDEVFGSDSWRRVASIRPASKTSFLIDQYRQTVERAGFEYVTDFELVDRRGHSLYLVHGTSHRRGLEKIKEAMWTVDSSHGIGYRDPRDPGQQTLDIEFGPVLAPLRRLILRHLHQSPDYAATVQQLREFTLFETFFKPGHVRGLLREMVTEGDITRDEARGDLNSRSIVRLPVDRS